MPIYEYRCPEGPHILDHIHRFSEGDRPDTIPCAKHGTTATHILSLPALGKVAGSDNPVKAAAKEWSDEERQQRHRGLDLGTFDYRCEPCSKTFNVLVDFRAGEKSEDPRPCPTCGAPSPLSLSMPHIDQTLVMYPYFDRGLDRVVESAQHRRQICKDEGYTPVDGDYDASRMFADATRPGRMAEAAYKADMKQRWDDPEMREYRDDYKARTGTEFTPPF